MRCLEKNPKYRLGSQNGLMEILDHPWFKGLSVSKMLAKEYKPAYVPKLSKDMLDCSYFSKHFTREEAVVSVLPK